MIYTETWNVMTMLQTGRVNEFADEMLKTQLQLVALQELKWIGVGQINKPEYTLYYRCNPGKAGQLGTGFMICNEIKKNILRFELYNGLQIKN
jgi:hypothetical protein